MHSNLVSKFAESGVNLIVTNAKDISSKIKGVNILDCLFDVHDDMQSERRMQIGEQLFKILR